mmetsp:Transcript_12353/g.24513  ORF Transcript_12353/g.24513 Transcript_12353/m.24513 type:complete len:266 (+) Transcript_12353:149-946(+)
MPWPGLLDDLLSALPDGVVVGEEEGGVEVALDGRALGAAGGSLGGVEAGPALGHVHRPVEGDHVDAGVGHALKEGSGVLDVHDGGEVGVGLLDLVEDHLLVGGGELVVVLRAQVAGPRVEHLYDLRSRRHLVQRVLRDRVREVLEHGVEEGGVGVHHLLDLEVLLAGAALDEVRGERVGATDEAEDGGLVVDGVPEPAEALVDKGAGLEGVDEVHVVDGLPGVHLAEDGTLLLLDVELEAEAGEGREDVREEDAAVGAIVAPGLE